MVNSSWRQEELSLIRALALQVRLLTAAQVARGWFDRASDRLDRAVSALDRLRRSGWVERLALEAHPALDQRRPLFIWKVGMRPPGPEQLVSLADQSRRRWRLAHEPVEAYRASRRACRVFGAFVDASHLRTCEATHDLHLAEVFVRYLGRKPRLGRQWWGEGAFPKLGFEIRGMKDPDAFLLDASGIGFRVIESSGSYDVDHLRAFHAHCAGGAAERLAQRGELCATGQIKRLYPPEGIGYELW